MARRCPRRDRHRTGPHGHLPQRPPPPPGPATRQETGHRRGRQLRPHDHLVRPVRPGLTHRFESVTRRLAFNGSQPVPLRIAARQARGPRPSGSSARDLLCPAVAEGEVDDGARCLIPQWPSREGTDVLFVVQCEINPAVEQASTKAAIRGVGASPSPLRYVPYNSSNILPAAASSAGRCPTQPGRHSRA